MGVLEGNGKIESIHKIREVELEVIYRYKQGLEAWDQVLIVRKVIESYYWLVPLFCAGDMGVYIAYHILKDDCVGFKYMKITHYDSMVGLMKDV